MFFNENEEILALGSHDENIYIYEKSGGVYTISQILSAGERIYCLKIDRERMVAAGHFDKILLYEYNGSEYVYDTEIQTQESVIIKISTANSF